MNTDLKQKISIIGCGMIAGELDTLDSPYFLTHAKAIKEHPSFILYGCYDKDIKKAEKFSKKWNCEKIFNSVDQMIDNNTDIYVIATTTASHYELLEKLILKNVPIIICEKPLVNNIEELNKINHLMKISKTKIIVNYLRRFDINHQNLKKYISSEELGEISNFYCKVSKGLVHNGSHFIDLLSYMFGKVSEIKSLRSKIYKDDLYGTFFILLDNGKEGIINVIENVNYSLFEVDLIFENGRILIKNIGYDIKIFHSIPSNIYNGFNILFEKEVLKTTFDKAFYYLYDSIYKNNINYDKYFLEVLMTSKLLLEFKEKVI